MTDATALVRLDDTDLTLAEPADDVRGRTVIDAAGDDIGEVDALIIDQHERRVRFLTVGSGGFLGLGKQKVLIPVDAVTDIDDERVHVNTARDKIAEGPAYEPDLVLDRAATTPVYDYYGFTPFWTGGYVPPAFLIGRR